jgi:hypothetical protein
VVKAKPSTLAEALNGDLRFKPGPKCSVGKLLKKLPPEDAAALEAVIARIDGDEVTAAAVSRVLAANGHKVSDYMLGHHRKGYCSCDHR